MALSDNHEVNRFKSHEIRANQKRGYLPLTVIHYKEYLELHKEQELEEVRIDKNHSKLDNLPQVHHDQPYENDQEFQKETTSTSQQSRSSTQSNEGRDISSIKQE